MILSQNHVWVCSGERLAAPNFSVFPDIYVSTVDSDLEAIRTVSDENGGGKLTAADAAFADFKLMVTNADSSKSVITLADANQFRKQKGILRSENCAHATF